MIDDSRLIERLRDHRLIKALPPAETDWVAAHGEGRLVREGEVISSTTVGPLEELLVILSGQISVWVDRGLGPRKVTEWGQGEISGRLPYSRQTGLFGEVRVDEAGEIVTVHMSLFPELIRNCPELTAKLVQQMIDRARLFTRYDLQNEKMISLGRLAAGLAHELDNPASALVRGARSLIPVLEEVDAASRALGSVTLPAGGQEAIDALRKACFSAPVQHVRSPLDQARHEDAIMEWLESRDLDGGGAEALADTSLTEEMLDALEEAVDPDVLGVALRWVATGCRASSLVVDLGRAADRISELVKAVKGFTRMDAAPVPEAIDLQAALTQTLAMLRSKARDNKVGVKLSIEQHLPPVLAVGGELNQIWFNLMDNALDAVQEAGSVEVHAARKGDQVIVRVVDTGAGVPPEIQGRIFEPFFTTKPVGQGTGLGLDIVRRLVTQQGGSVDLDSRPGHTEFSVTLPIAASDGRGAR